MTRARARANEPGARCLVSMDKMAKYVKRIELVDRFDAIGRGKGGYWEDRDYEWYAGI